MRRYAIKREIAAALQRSLLPQVLPELPGIEACARYLPGAAGADIGGDWYDLFPLPEGRVGIALGDVAGRGIAASVMSQLRMAL